MYFKLVGILLILQCVVECRYQQNPEDLIVMTIAKKETDGYKRFLRSVQVYDLNLQVYENENSLLTAWEVYKHQSDLVILFTTSSNTVFTNGKSEILDKFRKFHARLVFSDERFETLNVKPKVNPLKSKMNEMPFGTGGLIGYATDLYENYVEYTKGSAEPLTSTIMDKPSLLDKWNAKFDMKSEIFLTLNGVSDDVVVKYSNDRSYLYNIATETTPLVVRGNGEEESDFNRIANYLADSWTPKHGCMSCFEESIDVHSLRRADVPTVLIGFFSEHLVPFIDLSLSRIMKQRYPKEKIDFFIHNKVVQHERIIETFLDEKGGKFKSVTYFNSSSRMSESEARNMAVELCEQKKCQYFFAVDSDVHLTEPTALITLIEQNRAVLAPLLVEKKTIQSNFWGAIDSNGCYATSDDYMAIVKNVRRGLWNVPFISKAYLINSSVLPVLQDAYSSNTWSVDMAFCKTLREKGIFIYITNQIDAGYLIEKEILNNTLHPDLYLIFQNPQDWEEKYINPNFYRAWIKDFDIAQPCPDVFTFPLFTDIFCIELLEEISHHNFFPPKKQGKLDFNNPPDLEATGIDLKEIRLEKTWEEVFKKYLDPVHSRIYPESDSDDIYETAVVRNSPTEIFEYYQQTELRRRHQVMVNVALNRPNIDYEGGGYNFVRYNCTVTNTRRGWALMHTGIITHYHTNIGVTRGEKFALISFKGF